MRGEYIFSPSRKKNRVELPPRARRIPPGVMPARLRFGTTSACAENTWLRVSPRSPVRNYLRVRGEYRGAPGRLATLWELPPRARRIPNGLGFFPVGIGTTSACAENTLGKSWIKIYGGNYLRVRGEYPHSVSNQAPPVELPPRARRILPRQGGEGVEEGTTSACAENTARRVFPAPLGRNYLRVRGEYLRLRYQFARVRELPPRARRIPRRISASVILPGTTSACAENT